jgi:hypothetical protein
MMSRMRLLDLRDQRQPGLVAQELDVLDPAHERDRDDVDAEALADAQVGDIRLGHGGQLVDRVGDVDALARDDASAHLDLGVDLAVGRPDGAYPQAHGAVGEVDHLAGLEGV